MFVSWNAIPAASAGASASGHVAPGRVLAPLTGDPWRYRRRARLSVKHVEKKGRTLVGFRERAKPYVAALTRCEPHDR